MLFLDPSTVVNTVLENVADIEPVTVTPALRTSPASDPSSAAALTQSLIRESFINGYM